MFNNPITAAIAEFLISIGLQVIPKEINQETVLPGILIENGNLIIDEGKLLYPGDLLHEAGHIAVKPSAERENININVGNDPAEEMMSLAWSYAASVHINISPEVVFHPHGYKGQSQQLIAAYQKGFPVGLPMLQWLGMSADVNRAAELGIEPFPKMIKWLRD